MRYTEGAEAELESYLGRVRRGLDGRPDVDAADVAGGIREHVETELASKGADPATREDVAEVLERLGSVESVVDVPEGAEGRGEAEVGRGAVTAVAGVAAVGIALLPTRHMPVGVSLLLVSVAAARLLLPGAGPGVEARVLGGLWRSGAGVLVVALLLAPAVWVWGAAQIGGVLEGPLGRHVEVAGAERPVRYWGAMAATAGAVTGLWWTVLALLARRFKQPARGLAVAGGVLFLVSAIGVWLS